MKNSVFFLVILLLTGIKINAAELCVRNNTDVDLRVRVKSKFGWQFDWQERATWGDWFSVKKGEQRYITATGDIFAYKFIAKVKRRKSSKQCTIEEIEKETNIRIRDPKSKTINITNDDFKNAKRLSSYPAYCGP